MAERLLSVVLIYLLLSPTQAILPPKLVVNKRLITETDSVTLDCQTPHLPVFQCYFVTVDTRINVGFSCMATVTGSELLRHSQQVPPAVVQVRCFYTIKYGDLNSPSPRSNIFPITIQAVPQTTSQSVASTSGTPASGVIGSTSRPSTLTPPTSDVASNVPASLTPWLPTRTQTQGQSSSSSNPASGWSTAGWTLAHTGGSLTSSLKPGGAASDERDEKTKAVRWMVKVVIALASFGVTVGVILLGLALRRTVSERTRRSEHQNIEDDCPMYSNISNELAPSFKENIIYSKVEETSK